MYIHVYIYIHIYITPFADLAYTFAMSHVPSVFRNSLAIHLESHIEVNSTHHQVEDVSFADDVIVLIVDELKVLSTKSVLLPPLQ